MGIIVVVIVIMANADANRADMHANHRRIGGAGTGNQAQGHHGCDKSFHDESLSLGFLAAIVRGLG